MPLTYALTPCCHDATSLSFHGKPTGTPVPATSKENPLLPAPAVHLVSPSLPHFHPFILPMYRLSLAHIAACFQKHLLLSSTGVAEFPKISEKLQSECCEGQLQQ